MPATRTKRRGSALLAVLWLSAALGAVAFSIAVSVRGETERAATATDSLRAYYLARGALDRALLYMEWGPVYRNPDGTPRYYMPGNPRLDFQFPTGGATVEIVPESSKLNVNLAPPEEIFRLLAALGVAPDRAQQITDSIIEWRTPAPAVPEGPIDYLTPGPSFRPAHASFQEIEELLLVRGMTPDLFYGSYERDAGGGLAQRGGLRDCVTVRSTPGAFDANTAEPALLLSIGVPPEAVRAIIEARRRAPFAGMDQVRALAGDGPELARLRIGGNSTFTMRATARPRLPNGSLSDERRSVAALVKWLKDAEIPGHRNRYAILRWYDNVWVR